MSDLSRLLDDVYGDRAQANKPAPPVPEPVTADEPAQRAVEPAPQVPPPGMPDWANDQVLDDALDDALDGWSPAAAVTGAHEGDDADLGADDDLRLDGPSAEDRRTRGSRSVFWEDEADVEAEVLGPWSREHDDILPTGAQRNAGRSLLRLPARFGRRSA